MNKKVKILVTCLCSSVSSLWCIGTNLRQCCPPGKLSWLASRGSWVWSTPWVNDFSGLSTNGRPVMDLVQVLCSNPASTGISYGYLVSDICLQYQAVYMSKKFEDKFQPGANEWVAHWVHCGVNSIKNSLSKKCFFLCATETCMS